ncbi:MAG: DNA-directed RNA polymerase subunit omega [Clostridia bacterium]|nr:DNA-directed RNA polymerase subunit omega [Clostridia bacterium]
MINKPSTEELLNKSINRYDLVSAISKRARQLQDGQEKLIETDEPSKVTIASLEMKEGKINIVKKSS